MKNRKGEELVEAALIFPIVILTIISMLMLLIYFFSCLNKQVDLHQKLLMEIRQQEYTCKVIQNKEETSKDTGGLVNIILHKECIAKVHAFRESFLIRTGEKIL